MISQSDNLLSVEGLSVHFATGGNPIKAVDGVHFSARPGETTALVGESGCGKTVSALALARLVAPPGHIAGGRVVFAGNDIAQMDQAALRRLRGAEISYIFQEPSTSLNPVFTVSSQVAEAIRLHRRSVNVASEVAELLKRVGLEEYRARSYPHELSGGMQQRVMIAMALACRPKLLIADEPTTALDVTIQAQILDLLAGLQQELGMAVLLITHNLGLVADIAHRVYVMYAGRIVECASAEALLTRPLHPYTRGLLRAVPRMTGAMERVTGIPGSVPNPARPPAGCRFHPRCPRAQEKCSLFEPEFTVAEESSPVHENNLLKHGVRCHFWK